MSDTSGQIPEPQDPPSAAGAGGVPETPAGGWPPPPAADPASGWADPFSPAGAAGDHPAGYPTQAGASPNSATPPNSAGAPGPGATPGPAGAPTSAGPAPGPAGFPGPAGTPGTPTPAGAGTLPPGAGWGGPGGPSYPGPPYGAMPYGTPYYGPPPAGPRRRKGGPAIAAVLVAGTVAASAVATHALWPSSTSTAAANATAPSSGSSGSQTPSYGSYGSGGSGSDGSGSNGSYGSYGSPASSSEGSGGPSDVSSIASKVDPDLVIIDTTFQYQDADGAGTGIVLTSDGEILTNNHVIDGATSIKVTDVGNGQTYSANVVGYDPTVDVAILQLVDAHGLKTASIASSAAKVGQQVVAIGNAGGTGSLTPAGGTVTALNQAISASDELDGTTENLTGLIETNADVQSGDSGGSLVNTAGQVVGMDTAAAEGYSLQSEYGSTSQGYAIPINTALSIAKEIESGQSSSTVHIGSTAFLGVLLDGSSSSDANGSNGYGGYSGDNGFGGGYSNYYGGSSVSGVEIGGVVSGGAADEAGLTEGDTITAVAGQTVSSATDLSKLILADHPGQTIQVTYTDTSGDSHTVDVTLQSGPPA